jgi:rubrerythrin
MSDRPMTDKQKPRYLGLLNEIALAESAAHRYLTKWAKVTDDPDVRQVLLTVAAREGEHGMSFARRINELGYQVRHKDQPRAEKALDIVRSDCSDLEKMEALGLQRLDTGSAPDLFDDIFKDHSIDIRTGELLGRYIAEERDSARMLRSCYECLRAAKDEGDRAEPDRLAGIETKVDALGRAVDELRQIVCGASVATNSS